jgi:sugar lactone lactonase YvrE
MNIPITRATIRPLAVAACAFAISVSTVRAQMLTITTLAGANGSFGSGDGTGSSAQFFYPVGVAIDASGNLYIGDEVNCTIRMVTPAGVVTTYAGAARLSGGIDGSGSVVRFDEPNGVAVDGSGNVYVADTGNSAVRKIAPSGLVTTFAGYIGSSGDLDGLGTNARLTSPFGLAIDGDGSLYVADSAACTIRKVSPNQVVTTLAGEAGVPGNADGVGTAAQFSTPCGVAVDRYGNVYVADTGNNTIRKITAAGVVTTLAGTAGLAGSADGNASRALFWHPSAVAIDGSGNLFVADSNNNKIREISPQGTVTTVAGSSGNNAGDADGTGPSALLNTPEGIAVGPDGGVYIVDTDNETIRKGAASAPTIGTAPVTQSVAVGSTVNFSVAASSVTPVSYQWSFNGSPIAGATAPAYTTRPLQLSDQGLYSAAVSNGSATSVATASLSETFPHGPTYLFDNWTPSTPLPTGTSEVAAAFDGGNFVVVGLDGTAFYSPDGVNWTASASNGPRGQTWGELNAIVSVLGRNMLVAVGNGGAVVTYASGTYDGTLQASGSTSILTGIALGNQTLVAVGYGGTCIRSGLTASGWKQVSAGTAQNLNAIAYGNGRFVAVGLGGTVVTSPDGSTWSVQQLGSTEDLYGVAYGTRGFVAVGADGSIFASPDGKLWAPQASPTPNVLVHVGYGYGTFVAVGLQGTVLTSSDEGETWTGRESGTTARLDGIAPGKGIFVLTGTGGVEVSSGGAQPSRLANLSSRSTVGTDANILIAGFIVGGTGSKQVVLRGIGPTLGDFGVAGALMQPTLSLVNSGGSMLGTNSTWGGGVTLSQAFTQVGAFALPATSADAAMLVTLGGGAYTSQVSGLSATTGVGLAEIYDADSGTSTSRLVNLSSRASVGTAGNILIAGFVITGNTPETVLIRGIGPTLGQFGVSGALATPQLVLYDSNNDALQSNGGWGGSQVLAQTFAQVGAFPLNADSADAAILVTLPPGAYTAEVTGVNGAMGVGLAEIYEVP